jgi:hypothetical protein
MSVRYHVLASDELMSSRPLWPEGFRPLHQEPTDPGRYPGMHWWLVEDDGAPAGLDGERVDLTVRSVRGRAEITGRRVMP